MKVTEKKQYTLYHKGNILLASAVIIGYITVAVWLIYIHANCEKIVITAAFLILLNSIPIALLFGGWKVFINAAENVICQRESCTQPVDAVLCEFEKKTVDKYNDYVTYYYAVYEYTWQGRKYRVKSNQSFAGLSPAGVKCCILIDPDEPTVIYELNDEKSRIIQKSAAGMTMLIIGLFSTIAIFVLSFKA